MTTFPYQLKSEDQRLPAFGLLVLQTDERIEQDFRQLCPATHFDVLVSRVVSLDEVTPETLGTMAETIPGAAALFPAGMDFAVVGYGCTSGTSVIGPERIADLVRGSCRAKAVTEPVSALVAACRARGLQRIAFLSPYVESVSNRLRDVLADHGMETPVFGSFEEGNDPTVARISPASLREAALTLGADDRVEGIFLSCTNLDTLPVLADVTAALGKPALSSNFVLAEHMRSIASGGDYRCLEPPAAAD